MTSIYAKAARVQVMLHGEPHSASQGSDSYELSEYEACVLLTGRSQVLKLCHTKIVLAQAECLTFQMFKIFKFSAEVEENRKFSSLTTVFIMDDNKSCLNVENPNNSNDHVRKLRFERLVPFREPSYSLQMLAFHTSISGPILCKNNNARTRAIVGYFLSNKHLKHIQEIKLFLKCG